MLLPQKRNTGRDRALLKTWRQEGPTGARAVWWLITRRTAATLFAMLLISWLLYLLFSPLWLPRTFFTYFSADEVQSTVAAPIAFAYEDFAGFTHLSPALSPLASGSAPLQYSRLASTELFEAELSALQTSAVQANDTLIIYLAAHGVVRDGVPYLACSDFDPTEGDRGLYSCATLLDRLDDLPGETKLLLLDAGRDAYSPRIGKTLDQFIESLERVANARAPGTVWVLASHSPLEQSHVSAALKRSVFGYVAAQGLRGRADLNGDRRIELSELSEFVRHNVSAWVDRYTDGHQSQTPRLLGGATRSADQVHLLFTNGLPPVEQLPSVGAQIVAASQPAAGSNLLASTAEFFSARVSEFGVEPATAVAEGLASLVPGVDRPETEPSETAAPVRLPPESSSAKVGGEQQLFEQVWRLTAAVDEHAPHPIEYAPHLWRLHLERLGWLEQTQQSGQQANPRLLVDELRGLIRSLEAFNDPKALPADTPKNVVDQLSLLRPTVPLRVDEAPTVALLELAARVNQQEDMPKELAAFIEAYDRWWSSDKERKELDELIENSWDVAWDAYYEFGLIKQLGDRSDLANATIKRAFEARRLTEQVTADRLWGQGWAFETAAKADLMRLEAERLLRSRAASDWRERARRNLTRACDLYRDSLAQLSLVREVRRELAELLFRAHDYLRLRGYSTDNNGVASISSENAEELFAAISQTREELASPASGRVRELRRRLGLDRLLQIRFAIERDVAPRRASALSQAPYTSGDAWRLNAMLKTALLPEEDRLRCVAAAASAESESMSDFAFTPPSQGAQQPFPVARSRAADDQIRLAASLLKLTALAGPAGLEEPKDKFEGRAARNAAIEASLAGLPAAISGVRAANINLAQASERDRRVGLLKRATEALNSVDPIDATSPYLSAGGATAEASVTQALSVAEWYDLFSASRDRRLQAARDAAAAEASKLREDASIFRQLANLLPRQPPVTLPDPPEITLSVDGGSTLELVTEEDASVSLEIVSVTEQSTPVWLMAQYDERLLDVRADGYQLLQEHQLLHKATDVPLRYPYRPAELGVAETLVLAPGDTRRVNVRVSRRQATGGLATVAFKAITASNYLRHETLAQMPGNEELEVSIVSGKSVWRDAVDCLQVFPNRKQEVTVSVANKSGVAKSLTASLYTPWKAPVEPIPTGSIDAESASELLARLGDPALLAGGASLELPSDDTPTPVHFSFDDPANQALWRPSSSETQPQLADVGVGKLSDPPPKDEPLRQLIPRGILLALVDSETQRHTLRWIGLEVWKPKSYLQARGEYDPGVEEFKVVVSVANPDRMPQGRVSVELDIDRDALSPTLGRNQKVYLTKPTDRGVLSASLNPSRPTGELRAYVSVDGYPRAFEFRIRPATGRTPLVPHTSTTEVRVVSPAPGSPFAARPTVNAIVEVDAPDSAFDAPQSRVEIGVDRDRDRTLMGDVFVVRNAERDVRLYALQPSGGGTLAIQSEVSDFEIELPTDGISGRPVYVLGQVLMGGRLLHRHYREILLDGEGPVLRGPRITREEDALVAEISPLEPDLTGIESVRARIDAPEVTWVPAQPGLGDLWVVKLPTKKVPPGTYSLLIEAKDSVGNKGHIWKETVEVRPPAPKGDKGLPKTRVVKNRLYGRVVYGRRPVSRQQVRISREGVPTRQAKVGEGGRFDFGRVSAGTYALEARALGGGVPRTKEMAVEVSDIPNSPTKLEVKVR